MISKKGVIEGYKLRLKDQKRKAVEAFQNLGFSVSAAGDSYNDLGMLEAADIGVLFRAPNFLIKKYKLFSNTNNYEELQEHVNCSVDERSFSFRAHMHENLYLGTLDLGKYQRFMKIGIK